jgi:hypothetical protein
MENKEITRRIIILTREMYPWVGRIWTRFKSATVNPEVTV